MKEIKTFIAYEGKKGKVKLLSNAINSAKSNDGEN